MSSKVTANFYTFGGTFYYDTAGTARRDHIHLVGVYDTSAAVPELVWSSRRVATPYPQPSSVDIIILLDALRGYTGVAHRLDFEKVIRELETYLYEVQDAC